MGRPVRSVVGTDIDERLLGAARSFLDAEGIANVELLVDDLFASKLEPQTFDLLHARYVIAPLGRGREQAGRICGWSNPVVSGPEEWDLGSWHFNPPAPAGERLIGSLSEIFAALGGEAGRGLPELLREIGSRSPRSTRTWSRSNRVTLLAAAASVQRRARTATARGAQRG